MPDSSIRKLCLTKNDQYRPSQTRKNPLSGTFADFRSLPDFESLYGWKRFEKDY
jgi:hypothetical protein